MKRINILIASLLSILLFSACSDLLETESTRQNFEPEINEKTDSIFYTFGIMQAMQQLADQYVLQGEMRGDLVATTQYTDSMLTQLANFEATSRNRYDSAYVYYRVVNNCNYYIAHRDTSLYTGADNVTIHEYAAVKAFRAWAYLQLARTYGKVPFFTEPLTQISQIDNNTFPVLGLEEIVAELAPDLEQYTGFSQPTMGMTSHTTIAPNWESTRKTFVPADCYIPVDVILGDMYLEVGNYAKAASHFVTYLTTVSSNPRSFFTASMMLNRSQELEFDASQIKTRISYTSWSGIFGRNSSSDIISYIPMSANAQYGTTSELPRYFGADYYATPDEQTGYSRRYNVSVDGTRAWNYSLPLVTNVQIVPSDVLTQLSDSTEYYYYSIGGKSDYDSIRSANIGDMRLRNVLALQEEGDVTMQWITKYDFANIILYRNSTVLLHLAEAFNRLGMYDAAFAILKDGISEALIRPAEQANSVPYMTEETKLLLQTTYPLLKDSFLTQFPLATSCGIHTHGAGVAVSDQATTNYLPNKSPYRLGRIVGQKLQQVSRDFGVTVGTTKQDSINAIEDLLCDEYALELAFEGNRFFDLCRLARHKNGHTSSASAFDGSPSAYGANFGRKWIARKLAFKNASRITETSDDWWYLPFN